MIFFSSLLQMARVKENILFRFTPALLTSHDWTGLVPTSFKQFSILSFNTF